MTEPRVKQTYLCITARLRRPVMQMQSYLQICVGGVQVKDPKRAIEDATAVIEAVEGGAVHDAKQQMELRSRALYRCARPVWPHHVHRGRNRERSIRLTGLPHRHVCHAFRPCKSQARRCVWCSVIAWRYLSKSLV